MGMDSFDILIQLLDLRTNQHNLAEVVQAKFVDVHPYHGVGDFRMLLSSGSKFRGYDVREIRNRNG